MRFDHFVGYLKNHQQKIKMSSFPSSRELISSGFSQGSVVVPLLFEY